RPVFRRIFGIPIIPDRVAHAVLRLGDPLPYSVIAGVGVLLALVLLRDRVGAAIAGFSLIVAPVLAEAVGKPLVDRQSVVKGTEGFPSGHTAAMTVVAAVLVVLSFRRWGPRGAAFSLPVAAAVTAGMVLSVVKLHSHVMSDAIGGVLLGTGTVAGVTAVASSVEAARRSPLE